MAYVLTDVQRALLADFLRAQARFVHVWSEHDCGILLADWVVVAKSVPDPIADIRGTYHDAAGADAKMAAYAGLIGFVSHIADACACPATSLPKDGDVGIIDLPVQGPTCGLMTRGSWAFRTISGLAWSKVTPGRLVSAWQVFDA